MIVVDTNILIYRIVDGDKTEKTLRLEDRDSDWKTSPLWQYEFGNALILMIRQRHLTPKAAIALFESAHSSFSPGETQPDLDLAFHLAAEKKITFYDAQYLTLAHSLKVPLITEDRALRKSAGNAAMSLEEFLN